MRNFCLQKHEYDFHTFLTCIIEVLNLLLTSCSVHHSPTAPCLSPEYPNLWYSRVLHIFLHYIVLPHYRHAQSFSYSSWIFEKSLLYSTKMNSVLEIHDVSTEVRDRGTFLKSLLKCSVVQWQCILIWQSRKNTFNS